MRYYECTINANSEKIQKNAKIRLRDFDFDSPIAAVNKYIYRNIIANVQFFMYREEGNMIKAVVCYCDSKITYNEAFAAVVDSLDDAAGVSLTDEAPEEITTFMYVDCLLEAKRRGLNIPYNYLDDTNEFIYQAIFDSEQNNRYGFILDESIISDNDNYCKNIYDKSLLCEIDNIETHSNKTEFAGNMVHYLIASKGIDAAVDMAEKLLQSLYKAGRINSKRIEIVSEMDQYMYKKDTLSRLICGNFGGAVIIDLTEKFGLDPVDYELNCKYIENLVKRYKNDCLFIFTYNTDHPGITYNLMPRVNKHVAIFNIKEATCKRADAIAYITELIKNSNYSKFADQAEEFFDSFQGSSFSQTELLEVYEKFEPWCMNKNFYNAYNYNPNGDFVLERDSSNSSSARLEQLIGLTAVKEQIRKIVVTDIVEKTRMEQVGNKYVPSSMHMIFSGNPGTAKTTVAKLFAGIAKEQGILKSGAFIERNGSDYGTIDTISIKRDFEAAKGGVLFIDEAYTLRGSNKIAMFIQEMENRRDEVIVILAGYNDGMKAFIEQNEGLKSRIPFWVDFPDYSTDELVEIFKLMVSERGFTVTEDAIKDADIIFDKARYLANFGNGRYVRNIVEKAVLNQSLRVYEKYSSVGEFPKDELLSLTSEDILGAEPEINRLRPAGEARKEFDSMIGLQRAKEVLYKAIASFKMKKLYKDMGVRQERSSMHMVFTGNPGTAKTTTARLIAEILRDEKVLPSGNFVEVGRAELVGPVVGSTAPIVKRRFREAQGGVLFIDEAYSLCDRDENSFGDEAINTIVQEMENHREDVIVIFAGYPKEMKKFLERNPGMASRIAFQIEFDDYNTDDLCEIAKLMLNKKKLHLTDEAMLKLRSIFENARKNKDYGNGRYVRRMLEEAEMNLAQRVSAIGSDDLTLERITTLEACDIEEPKDDDNKSHTQMGFRAS